MEKLRIGIDNYGLQPLGLSPLELLDWAKNNGADGVQFSGLSPEESKLLDSSYLKDMAQFAADHNLYLEWGGGQHIPFNLETWEKKDILAVNRKAAQEAMALGARLVRSCSGGLMRWDSRNPETGVLLKETAQALLSLRQMLRDHGVILAIETHFEFTTHELLRLFERCGAEPGDYLGICLDTMNPLTMLEDPVLATERVLPWVVSSHIKDGGLLLDAQGFTTFPAEIGKGVVDLKKIGERLASLPHKINLSVEDHGGSFSLPIFEPRFLAEFPELSLQEFISLVKLAQKTGEALSKGQVSVTERADWPGICESRISQDIRSLRELLTQGL